MALRDYTPLAMLTTEQKVEQFRTSGELFTIDGLSVNAPSDWGPFPCIYDLLNGRGSRTGTSLGELVDAAATAAGLGGTWDVSIDADDKINVRCTVPGATAFTVSANAALGFTSSKASTLVSGVNRAVAQATFSRDLVTHNDLNLEITTSPGGVVFDLSAQLKKGYYQGVLEAVRRMDATDELGGYEDDNLTALSCAAVSNNNVRWMLNEDGKVAVSYPTSMADIEWTDTTFREWLGFTGEELHATVVGQYKHLTATYHPKGIKWLTRGLEVYEPGFIAFSEEEILSDLRIERTNLASGREWTVGFTIEGLAAETDEVFDLLDDFLYYLVQSDYFTVYPNRREHRKATSRKDGYSRALTPELDRRVGWNRLTLAPGQSEWLLRLANPRLRKQYQPIELVAWEYVPE